MNNRFLLKKYLTHIRRIEGITYLKNTWRPHRLAKFTFTDEEWAELRKLDQEILNEEAEKEETL